MPLQLDGATRLIPIVGDPIAQVKSPAGVSEQLQSLGLNTLIVPLHIDEMSFAASMQQLSAVHNIDGFIITIPHKFAAAKLCHTLSPAAAFLGAVNTLRRNPDGSWHGDMFDGLGYVNAVQAKGCSIANKKALLIGAGGAASAIAYALMSRGLAELDIAEVQPARAQQLVSKLAQLGLGRAAFVSEPIAANYDIVINASPMGMRLTDPLPVQLQGVLPSTFVGDVITAPVQSPLLLAAQALGCKTQSGADMFNAVRGLMVDFLTPNSTPT